MISAEWWKKWMNYVKIHEEETSLKDSFETSPIRQEGSCIHPGKIINRLYYEIWVYFSLFLLLRELIEPECLKLPSSKIKLKENLLEHLDFEAIPKHIYLHLKKWYGTDYDIMRFLKKNPEDENMLFLELYPGFLKIL